MQLHTATQLCCTNQRLRFVIMSSCCSNTVSALHHSGRTYISLTSPCPSPALRRTIKFTAYPYVVKLDEFMFSNRTISGAAHHLGAGDRQETANRYSGEKMDPIG